MRNHSQKIVCVCYAALNEELYASVALFSRLKFIYIKGRWPFTSLLLPAWPATLPAITA